MLEEQRSEVARLMAEIENEYVAARQALYGSVSGMTRHEFITKRMEHMGECHRQLALIVGAEATMMVATAIQDQPA